jgi:peptidoglycan hydrolase CwlO-like protein
MKKPEPAQVLAKYASEIEAQVRAQVAKEIKNLKASVRKMRTSRDTANARNRELRAYIAQCQKQVSELRSRLRENTKSESQSAG